MNTLRNRTLLAPCGENNIQDSRSAAILYSPKAQSCHDANFVVTSQLLQVVPKTTYSAASEDKVGSLVDLL